MNQFMRICAGMAGLGVLYQISQVVDTVLNDDDSLYIEQEEAQPLLPDDGQRPNTAVVAPEPQVVPVSTETPPGAPYPATPVTYPNGTVIPRAPIRIPDAPTGPVLVNNGEAYPWFSLRLVPRECDDTLAEYVNEPFVEGGDLHGTRTNPIAADDEQINFAVVNSNVLTSQADWTYAHFYKMRGKHIRTTMQRALLAFRLEHGTVQYTEANKMMIRRWLQRHPKLFVNIRPTHLALWTDKFIYCCCVPTDEELYLSRRLNPKGWYKSILRLFGYYRDADRIGEYWELNKQ